VLLQNPDDLLFRKPLSASSSGPSFEGQTPVQPGLNGGGNVTRYDLGLSREEIRAFAVTAAGVGMVLMGIEYFGKKLRKPPSAPRRWIRWRRGALEQFVGFLQYHGGWHGQYPTQTDATFAIKSPGSTYPSAVIRLVAGCNLSGASVILEGSQTLAANAAAIVAPIHPLQGLSPKRG
jgi:hypothetical protein